MTRAIYALVFTVVALCFAAIAGGGFVLMGVELKRKGRPAKFLSLAFNLMERIRIAQTVFKNYKQLKQDEGRVAVLPWLVWVSVPLFVLFLILSVVPFFW